jgi:hypothetical protein
VIATRLNLYAEQGASWESQATLVDAEGQQYPSNTAGWSAMAGAVRELYADPDLVSNSAFLTMATSLSTGSVGLSLTANQTSGAQAGRWLYEVRVVSPDGAVTRVQEGILTIAASPLTAQDPVYS